MHTDFARALYEIGEDRDNRVLVPTGTGDRFTTEIDRQSLDDPTKPAVCDKTPAEGRRIMQRLVDLEMPAQDRANVADEVGGIPAGGSAVPAAASPSQRPPVGGGRRLRWRWPDRVQA